MKSELIGRRDVITSGVTLGAGICWSWELAAAVDVEPVKFIVVTDTHLGRKDNLSAEKNWRQAITEINEQPGRLVLHLGDVVDSGRPEQYPVYLDTIKSLNKPIHAIPGNHDPAELFHKHVSEQTDRSIDSGGIRFVLFNNAHRDSHDGFITPEQVAWIDEQCNGAVKKQLKIVICCHVPIHTNRHPDRGWYVKPKDGQTAFYEVLQRHQDRILTCLHGHFHNGIRGWRDHGDTVEVLCPSVCYNQNRRLTERIAEGKATGFFVDELRPGFVLAEIGAGRLSLQYKPLGVDPAGQYAAEWDG